MKTLCWNARGLRNPRALYPLSGLIRVRRPSILFLSETKSGETETNKIKRLDNFPGCLMVKSVDLRGGLCLLWAKEANLRVNFYSLNHIDSIVEWEGRKWKFTRIYGHPEGYKKKLTWRLIRHLHRRDSDPWVIGGAINEILRDDE